MPYLFLRTKCLAKKQNIPPRFWNNLGFVCQIDFKREAWEEFRYIHKASMLFYCLSNVFAYTTQSTWTVRRQTFAGLLLFIVRYATAKTPTAWSWSENVYHGYTPKIFMWWWRNRNPRNTQRRNFIFLLFITIFSSSIFSFVRLCP